MSIAGHGQVYIAMPYQFLSSFQVYSCRCYLKGLTKNPLNIPTCLGYQNVCVLDAISKIKDWQTTTEMIKSDIPMPDVYDGSGWNYHEDLKLFFKPS